MILQKAKFLPILSYALIPVMIIGSVTVTAQTLQSRLSQQIAANKESQSEIESARNEVLARYQSTERLKQDIQAQQNDVETQIAELESLIQQNDEVLENLNSIITENERQKLELEGQLKDILRELQKKGTSTPLQEFAEVLVSGGSIIEGARSVYDLSILPGRLESLVAKIETKNKEIEENKTQVETTKQQQQQDKDLQDAFKDTLEFQKAQAQAELDKDSAILATIANELAAKEAEAAKLQRDFEAAKEAERQRLINEAIQAANNGNNGGTTGGGNTNPNNIDYVGTVGKCYFEDGGNPGLDGMFIHPTAGRGIVTDNFGCPPFSGWRAGHDGMDIAAGAGTPIYAAAGGVVERRGFHPSGFGNWVLLRHVAGTGVNVYTLYAHLQSPAIVAPGQGVAAGQQIGFMGTTGYSTGVHLHFMILSPSYAYTGNVGCQYGSSKCYNPARFIAF